MPFSDEIKQNTHEENTIDVNVIKKGKRILVFLADFFIHFIITFFIFNLAIIPAAKAITSYDAKETQYIQEKKNLSEVFLQNEIMFSKYKTNEDNRYEISLSMEYTYDRFLSYYVLEAGEIPDEDDPNFKHDIKNEVFNTFYNNIREYEPNVYIEKFTKYNQTNNYFDIVGNIITLKTACKQELHSYFEKQQGHYLTDLGKEYFDNIKENLFLMVYGDVLNNIKENDLVCTFDGATISYLETQQNIKYLENYHINMITTSAIISYVLIWAIYYIVLPLFLSDRATLGMLILKVDRININNFSIFTRKMTVFVSIYPLFSNLMGIMFLPLFLVPFNYLFNLSVLSSLSFVSVCYIIGSLIFLLFSNFSQTLSDKFTRSVMLLNEDLDVLYRSRGYLNGK